MARDKAKDDKYFNCSQEHEINYVAGLYAKSSEVKSFLIIQCRNGKIKYMTHMEVYEMIKKELGFQIPI